MKISRKAELKVETTPLNLLPQGHLFTIPNITMLKPQLGNTDPDEETIFMKLSDTDEILEVETGKLWEDDELDIHPTDPVIDVDDKYTLQEL